MQEYPDTGLIIIDTLKRVREAGGADYSYASYYDIVARLKALADSYKVTMLIVHHTRKQKAEDIFDMISGTNGLMGAADGAFESARYAGCLSSLGPVCQRQSRADYQSAALYSDRGASEPAFSLQRLFWLPAFF